MKLILPEYINSLNISDLNYLLEFKESSFVVGGNSRTSATTVTVAGSGYAVASASSSANGNATYTGTQTSTNVGSIGFLDYSSANAKALAIAQTSNQKSIFSSNSSSIWLSVTTR